MSQTTTPKTGIVFPELSGLAVGAGAQTNRGDAENAKNPQSIAFEIRRPLRVGDPTDVEAVVVR